MAVETKDGEAEDEAARAERKRLRKLKKEAEAAGKSTEEEEAKREKKRLKKEKKARESMGGDS